MCSDIFIRPTIYLLGVWRNRRSYIYISTLCQYISILTVTKFAEMNRVVGRSVFTLLTQGRNSSLALESTNPQVVSSYIRRFSGPQRITLVSCRSFSVASSLSNEAMPLPSKDKVILGKLFLMISRSIQSICNFTNRFTRRRSHG